MNKSLLVEIFADVGEASGFIATGYPVAKDLVITARHAVYPEGATPRKLKLRWYNQSDEAREKQEIELSGCVAWDGGEKLDVVLITCQLPVSGFGCLSSRKPETGMEWESEGFAQAGAWGTVRPPTPMKGEVFSAADASDTFQLGTDNPVSKDEGWQGASGSPVFVEGKIIGIITSCPRKFNATRFNATPVWKLLQEDKFRRLVGYDKREKQLSWARQELKARLGNDKVLSELCACLEQAKSSAETIAAALLESPIEQILGALGKAHFNLKQQNDSAGLECIRDLLYILLPSVFDYGSVALVQGEKKGFRYNVLSLPAATKTAAEIIMAGVDMRAAAFKPLKEGEDLPEGIYSLPDPPEGGIQKQGEGYINNFHNHMIKKFTGAEVPAHAKPETKIIMAANKLKFLANHRSQPRSHYYLYFLPDGDAERNLFSDVINKLQTAYPAAAFINLSTDQELLIKEYEQLSS
ncbi:MAG: hypothetical protein GY862_08300 [Gammaproteobacteria bacterium]|nr:hypothetical protein [Gammaproteobacteria bacterium]